MRIGTPGFVAARLAEGREVRGLTQTSLAELTGIKSQSISHYEQGRQSPSPEALALLSIALELPERFFLRAAPPAHRDGIFFRTPCCSLKPHGRAARSQAEARLSWAKEISAYLRRFVEFPASLLPDIPVVSNEDIEAAAQQVRSVAGSGAGPLEDLLNAAEDLGVVVTRLDGLDPSLHPAFAQWDEGSAFIVLNAAERRPSWLRYAAAHELGHLVMHRHAEREALEHPDTHRTMERQADRFARALLMPAAAFAADVWAPTVNALLTLKRDWRSPLSAMVTRCGEVGIFDADQLRRAAANLARRGWKATEPREDESTLEAPRLLARSVCLLVENRLKDRHAILTELGMRAADVEEICDLPSGYLSTSHAHPALRLRAIGLRDDTADVSACRSK